jgi:hypothetical protein
MKKDWFEFFSIGILTPILYVIFFVSTVLVTFLVGMPIAFGIYLIDLALKILFFGS